MASSDLYTTLGYMPNVYHPQRPIQPREINHVASLFCCMSELEVYHFILQQISRNISSLAEIKDITVELLESADKLVDPTSHALVKAINIDLTDAMELESIQYNTMKDMELSEYRGQRFKDLPLGTRDAWPYEYLVAQRRRDNIAMYLDEWYRWLYPLQAFPKTMPPDPKMSYTDAEAACMAEFSDKTEIELFGELESKTQSSQIQLAKLDGIIRNVEWHPSCDQEALAFKRKVDSIVRRGYWNIEYPRNNQHQTTLKCLPKSAQSTWIENFRSVDAIVKEVEGLTAWWNNLPHEIREPAMVKYVVG
ncbi:hypothetical protein E8E14_003213 [Neopestalotiopsis sp. 37M]|nr:hypothetical protein E8E14_003213 [Neopestalotiopsis sp. 37M]